MPRRAAVTAPNVLSVLAIVTTQ